jgi:cytochrome P450
VLPASSYSQRITSAPVQLHGHPLAAGTPVVFSQFITHHRHDLYHEPERFWPERWYDINPSAYEYLPFGAGPRMCIGAPLAMLELRAALCVILQRRHFQIQPESTVNARVVSTMLGPTSSIIAEVTDPSTMPVAVPVRGSIHELVSLPLTSTAMRRAA